MAHGLENKTKSGGKSRKPIQRGGSTGATTVQSADPSPLNMTLEQLNTYYSDMYNKLPDSPDDMIRKKFKQRWDEAIAEHQSRESDYYAQQGLQSLMNFDPTLLPIQPGDIASEMNALNQMLGLSQSRQERGLRESLAMTTGGRLGSTARGVAGIGEKVGIERALGVAQITQQARERQLQEKRLELTKATAGLQAYIQKYGIDKNAEIALKNMAQQMEALEAQASGQLFSNLAMLPFLL